MALFLGAIPTALAYVLFARGLRHLTPGETATLTLAEPLTATGLGILALGERPGAAAAIGAALVLAGLLTLAAPAARARAAEPVPAPRMTPKFAIERVSTVDAVAASLRTRILDGDLAPGERLREIELTEGYGVARHSLRAALRQLAGRGARDDRAQPRRPRRRAHASVEPLFELRTALEVEAARLALERHGGRMPKPVHDAVRLHGRRLRAARPAVERRRRGPRGRPPRDRRRRGEPAHPARLRRAGRRAAPVRRSASARPSRSTAWPPTTTTCSPAWRREGTDALRRHLAEGAATLADRPARATRRARC